MLQFDRHGLLDLRRSVGDDGACAPRSSRTASAGRTNTAVDHILNTPGLSDDERVAMLGETAEKLLSINYPLKLRETIGQC